MKKFIAILMCAAIVLSFAACGDDRKTNPDISMEQIQVFMDEFALHTLSFYKYGDKNKTAIDYDDRCLGDYYDQSKYIDITNEKIEKSGVCFGMSTKRFGASEDALVTCQLTDVEGRVYISFTGTVEIWSDEAGGVAPVDFTGVKFCYEDPTTYEYLLELEASK